MISELLALDRTTRGGIQTRSARNARLILRSYRMDIKFGLLSGVEMIGVWSEYDEAWWIPWTEVSEETIQGLQETIEDGEGVLMTKKAIREAVTIMAQGGYRID